jgi:hypothetical protein
MNPEEGEFRLAVSMVRIEALLEAVLDQLKLMSTALGAQADSRPSAWLENNSRGTTSGVKGYGQDLHDVVDAVASEGKRLQVLASGSLAGVMRDES